jgi:hypothetical protein
MAGINYQYHLPKSFITLMEQPNIALGDGDEEEAEEEGEESDREEGDKEEGDMSLGLSTCTTLNCPFSLGACTYTVLLVLDPMNKDLLWNPIAEAKPSNFDFSGEFSSEMSMYPMFVISSSILSISPSFSPSLPPILPTLP